MEPMCANIWQPTILKGSALFCFLILELFWTDAAGDPVGLWTVSAALQCKGPEDKK